MILRIWQTPHFFFFFAFSLPGCVFFSSPDLSAILFNNHNPNNGDSSSTAAAAASCCVPGFVSVSGSVVFAGAGAPREEEDDQDDVEMVDNRNALDNGRNAACVTVDSNSDEMVDDQQEGVCLCDVNMLLFSCFDS